MKINIGLREYDIPDDSYNSETNYKYGPNGVEESEEINSKGELTTDRYEYNDAGDLVSLKTNKSVPVFPTQKDGQILMPVIEDKPPAETVSKYDDLHRVIAINGPRIHREYEYHGDTKNIKTYISIEDGVMTEVKLDKEGRIKYQEKIANGERTRARYMYGLSYTDITDLPISNMNEEIDHADGSVDHNEVLMMYDRDKYIYPNIIEQKRKSMDKDGNIKAEMKCTAEVKDNKIVSSTVVYINPDGNEFNKHTMIYEYYKDGRIMREYEKGNEYKSQVRYFYEDNGEVTQIAPFEESIINENKDSKLNYLALRRINYKSYKVNVSTETIMRSYTYDDPTSTSYDSISINIPSESIDLVKMVDGDTETYNIIHTAKSNNKPTRRVHLVIDGKECPKVYDDFKQYILGRDKELSDKFDELLKFASK